MALPPGLAEWFTRTFKSSGLPAYQMSGPGLQKARQQQQGRNYYGPAYASAEALGLPSSSGPRNYGPGYREAELAAGAAAEAFRPGAGFPGQQAERAYESDKAAIAQQVAKDPRLSQYERDSAAAVASGDQARMDAVRDQGMAIWAQENRELAKKVKPGQVGYEAIQRALYPGGSPLPALPAESEAMLNAIAPVDATGIRPDVTPMPGQLPAFGTASDAMYQAVIGNGAAFTPMPQQQQAVMTPQLQAQELAEAEKQAMLARIFAQK
jgi:hypothetical protein